MSAQRAVQTTVNVISGAGSSLSDGAFTSATFDVSTNKPLAARLEFRGTCNDAALTLAIHCYLVPLAADGSSYSEDLDSDWKPYYVGSFRLKDAIATEQIAHIYDVRIPASGKGKLWLEADTDGTAVSSGYDLDLIPETLQDSA